MRWLASTVARDATTLREHMLKGPTSREPGRRALDDAARQRLGPTSASTRRSPRQAVDDLRVQASALVRALDVGPDTRVSFLAVIGLVTVTLAASVVALLSGLSLPRWLMTPGPARQVAYTIVVIAAVTTSALLFFRGQLDRDQRIRWIALGYAAVATGVIVEAVRVMGIVPAPGGGLLAGQLDGAAAARLLWHAALPTAALVVVGPRLRSRVGRRLLLGICVLLGAVLVSYPALAFLPTLVRADGSATLTLRALLGITTLYAGGAAVLWLRATDRHSGWPQVLVGCSLALVVWDLVVHVAVGHHTGPVQLTGMLILLGHTATPAIGLLGEVLGLEGRLHRYEHNLAGGPETEVPGPTGSHPTPRRDRSRTETTARIRQLLADGGPSTVFQPIVDLTDGTTVGVEALSRFPDPQPTASGVQPPHLGPADWFADATAVGLAADLELAAVRGALDCLPRLPDDVQLSVNVSPGVVQSGALHHLLRAYDASRIVVEITEHSVVDDYLALLDALRELDELGARIAVDDAGGGFASLRHVIRLAPHIIKLDLDLTANIETDPIRRALTASLVSFAAESDCELIAEGVENPDQLAVLQDLRVAYGQGYLLGPPAPLPVASHLALPGLTRAAASTSD